MDPKIEAVSNIIMINNFSRSPLIIFTTTTPHICFKPTSGGGVVWLHKLWGHPEMVNSSVRDNPDLDVSIYGNTRFRDLGK